MKQYGHVSYQQAYLHVASPYCVYLLFHGVLTTVGVPYDGVDVNEEVVAVQLSLTVILSLLSCAGIVFSIVCLVFNFYFRNQM